MLTVLLFLATAPKPGPQAPPNLHCPVSGREVSNHTLYKWTEVRGRRYYVCGRECAIRLRNAPSVYLKEDGTPRNEAP